MWYRYTCLGVVKQIEALSDTEAWEYMATFPPHEEVKWEKLAGFGGPWLVWNKKYGIWETPVLPVPVPPSLMDRRERCGEYR